MKAHGAHGDAALKAESPHSEGTTTLEGATTLRALVIGIGNPDRGDDAVGVEIARKVAAERLDIRVLELDDPCEALNAWGPADNVVVADAVRSGGVPGDIHVLDAVARTLPAGSWAAGGTHAMGLAAVVELGRALGRLPHRLVVVGVEAGRFDHGAPMSDAVAAAVPTAAAAVHAAIDEAFDRPVDHRKDAVLDDINDGASDDLGADP
jgi:hydrogenase maturation protease